MSPDAIVFDVLDQDVWRELAEERIRRRRPPVFRHYTQRNALAQPQTRPPLPQPHAEDCEFWGSDGDRAMPCTCDHKIPEERP